MRSAALQYGVDARFRGARRFKRLLTEFGRDLGGFDKLGEADRVIIRQAATATLKAEELQGAVIRGEAVDADSVIRLASESRRLLAILSKRKPARPTTGHAIRDYIANKGERAVV